jgi:hypothetical protein
MRKSPPAPVTSELCYLDASKVTSPVGVLSEMDLLTADGQPFGSIEGIVIEAAARRVRYFAVQSSGWFRNRRYLLDVDQLVQVEAERKALRLRGDLAGHQVEGLDTASLREFSDDDLLAILFRSRTAA